MKGKNHYVPVRLSDKEFRRLNYLAKASRLSRSEIIRKGFMGVKIYEAPKMINSEFDYQLAKIGNNINQLAKETNMGGNVQMAQIAAEFENLKSKVGEAIGSLENQSKELELETVD